MNKRWITLMGRAGTILMAAGLALVMLSLIPPRKAGNTDFRETSILQPKTFSIESPFFLSSIFDPQRGVYVSAQANHSVTAYLLNVGNEYVYEWITNHFSKIQPSSSTFDVSILDEFLTEHPNSVARRENTVGGLVEFQCAPTKLMNVTLIFSNPSTETVKVSYSGRLLSFLVPSERALNPAKFVIPIGFVLALPWLTLWKRRRTKLRNI